MTPSTPADDALALGIDIGGTKIAVALVDDSGTVLAHARGPVAPESNDAALESIFAVVDQLLASEPHARQRLSGIGAGAPGSIDWRRGVLGGATNLAWRNLELADALRQRYDLPALLDNDVNVAVWGEFSFGGWSVPIQNLVFIAVGTGIGCGIVESGRIIRGRRSAGEIGHIPILEHGPQCKCGMIGCLEAVASGPALGSAARALVEQGGGDALLGAARAAGGGIEQITAAHVVAAAGSGDAEARRLLDREGYYLALAVLIAGRMLDPEMVVIGGGLSEAGAVFFEPIWENLRRLRPRGADPRTYVVPSRLGAEAGAIGAAALILCPEWSFVDAGLVSSRA